MARAWLPAGYSIAVEELPPSGRPAATEVRVVDRAGRSVGDCRVIGGVRISGREQPLTDADRLALEGLAMEARAVAAEQLRVAAEAHGLVLPVLEAP